MRSQYSTKPPAEEGHEGQQVGWEMGQIEGDIQVQDIVSEEIMPQCGDSFVLRIRFDRGRDSRDLLGNICIHMIN